MGGEDDVRHVVERAEFALHIFAIEQIYRDPFHAIGQLRLAARRPIDLCVRRLCPGGSGSGARKAMYASDEDYVLGAPHLVAVGQADRTCAPFEIDMDFDISHDWPDSTRA